jgi:aminoglycoside phosphotransferase (APT) family kinase protein
VSEPNEITGIDATNVTAWLRDRVPALAEPLRFEPIAGGMSNLTFRVTDATGRRWVLRRPPLGHVLATAHDMGREFRIITALASTDVPVAPVVGHCEDEAVNGAPFYVMDFVDGYIARDVDAAAPMPLDVRSRACESLIEVLAEIHSVDVDAIGLGDLGRKEAYVERQLSRWQRQWEATKDVDVPTMEQLHAELVANIPEQGPATIVHGDYRLDNCIIDTDGSINAVLDWELCTLGDPLADVGLMLVYWEEPTDTFRLGRAAATTLEGFASRQHLLDLYGSITGRDLADIGFYIGLGYWKLACILQGVLVRYRSGAMGDQDSTSNPYGDHVNELASAGLAALRGRIGTTDV